MVKTLIYQGPSALFETFFKDFLGIGGQFVEIKELTKKDANLKHSFLPQVITISSQYISPDKFLKIICYQFSFQS